MTKDKLKIKNIKHKDKLLVAVFLVIIAYCIKFGTGKLIDWIIRSQLEFAEGSYHYRMWQTNRHPYKVDFYFYNWTNSEDVRNASVKPRFVEVGPYRFDMYINRTSIKIHQDNSSVTYSFTKRFVFVKDDDSRLLNDVIITLNPIANTVAYQARHWSTLTKFAASLALRATKSELFIKKTIGELLFEGYEDPLLSVVGKFPNVVDMGVGMKLQDKFGYFYKRNYTDLYFGPYNVHANVDDNYGDLQTIRGSTHTPFFPGQCGAVGGKLGEYVNPEHDRNEPLIIYVHDINVFTANHFHEERTVNGVVGSIYAPKDFIFDNGTYDKSSECFCNGECVPSGLLNSSTTFMNAPVFMSLPHFLLADASLKENIELIRMDNQSQLPYIAVEQATGLLLEGVLTTQLNMLLQPIKGLGMFADVPRTFVPVFSMRQHVVTQGAYLNVLILLQKMPILINCFSFVALFCGLGTLLYFIKLTNVQQNFVNYRPIKLLIK